MYGVPTVPGVEGPVQAIQREMLVASVFQGIFFLTFDFYPQVNFYSKSQRCCEVDVWCCITSAIRTGSEYLQGELEHFESIDWISLEPGSGFIGVLAMLPMQSYPSAKAE